MTSLLISSQQFISLIYKISLTNMFYYYLFLVSHIMCLFVLCIRLHNTTNILRTNNVIKTAQSLAHFDRTSTSLPLNDDVSVLAGTICISASVPNLFSRTYWRTYYKHPQSMNEPNEVFLVPIAIFRLFFKVATNNKLVFWDVLNFPFILRCCNVRSYAVTR